MKDNSEHSDDAGRDQNRRSHNVCETLQPFEQWWLSTGCADDI